VSTATTNPAWTFPDLEGFGVRLARADASHAPALFAVTPPDTFRYYIRWPGAWTLEEFTRWYEEYRAEPREHMYVVFDASDGRVLGSTSFLDIDPANRCVEIGATWYAQAARGTRVNPACKLIMLRHAFEALGCIRVTIKCNARNAHSAAAIRKLGATCEGVLRNHRVQCDGNPRDTMVFSVVPEEWPRVKAGLLARVAAPRSGV